MAADTLYLSCDGLQKQQQNKIQLQRQLDRSAQVCKLFFLKKIMM